MCNICLGPDLKKNAPEMTRLPGGGVENLHLAISQLKTGPQSCQQWSKQAPLKYVYNWVTSTVYVNKLNSV